MCDEPASGRRSSSPGGKSGGNGDTDDHPARKDLKAAEYEKLAREVLLICEKYQTKCMLHNFSEVAEKLWQDKTIYQPAGLHLPIGKFLALTEEQKKQIPLLGVSVHSLDEARQCERLGASYVTAGHIFVTDCKKGVPPRGLSYLREICAGVNIPVFAIGGDPCG